MSRTFCALLSLLCCTAALAQSTGLPDPNAMHGVSLSLYCVPAVSSSSSGPGGTLICSAITDNGTSTFNTEPHHQQNSQYMDPLATATSSANYSSNPLLLLMSYYNGVAVSTGWSIYGWMGTGTTPPTDLDFYGPPGLPATAILYALDPGLVATASLNYNSPKFKIRGNCWNGTAGVLDDWNWQNIVGTGANPTETLQFLHAGCSGQALVEMPGIKLDGPPYFATQTASNSDVAGELTFSAVTTQTYTWVNSYAVHPECPGVEPQFSTTVAHWVTYTGTTSFTINFASAVTGTVSYGCTGRT